MINTTTWHPDTCECEIHYSWDSKTDENNRVHTPVETFRDLERNLVTTRRCKVHSHHKDVNVLHAQILGENQSKNKAFHAILNGVDSVAKITVDDEGNQRRAYAKGKDFKWSFDADRNLVVDLVGHTPEEKALARAILDQQLPEHKDKIKLS